MKQAEILSATLLVLLLWCFNGQSSAQERLPTLVKRIQPAVVLLRTHDANGEPLAEGSAFFIDKEAHLVTNRHVLEGASTAEVIMANGKTFKVENVIAEDREGDLMKVSTDVPSSLVQRLTASSLLPEVGQRVVVVGHPLGSELGLEATVSDGIVSSIRDALGSRKMIQITAPISHGSSGGPVVNLNGEVVGVATMIHAEGQNVNFAMPAQRLMRLKSGKLEAIAEWTARTKKELLARLEKNYASALSFAFSGDYEKALQSFAAVLKEQPSYSEAWVHLAFCYFKLGHEQDALEALQYAIKSKPTEADTYFDIGSVYGSLRRSEESVAAYEQATLIQPDYAEAHNNLGVQYAHLGKHEKASESYRKAIEAKPDYSNAYYNLGLSYAELGLYQKAIESYTQAIRISPNFEDAYRNLGVTAGQLGRWQDAVDYCKEALKIKPDDGEAYKTLGLAYGMLGHAEEQMKAYQEAIRINPGDGDAHYSLGNCLRQLERYNDALEAYQRAIQAKPRDAEAYLNLGLTYANLKRNQEAIEALKQSVGIDPSIHEAHFGLGLVYLSLGDKDSARQEYSILKGLDQNLANKLFTFIDKVEPATVQDSPKFPIQIRIKHRHAWGMPAFKPAVLILQKDFIEFHEAGDSSHDFQIAVDKIIQFNSSYKSIGGNESYILRFSEKTRAGDQLSIEVDLSSLSTLVKYLKLNCRNVMFQE